jgi:hypothetical protein
MKQDYRIASRVLRETKMVHVSLESSKIHLTDVDCVSPRMYRSRQLITWLTTWLFCSCLKRFIRMWDSRQSTFIVLDWHVHHLSIEHDRRQSNIDHSSWVIRWVLTSCQPTVDTLLIISSIIGKVCLSWQDRFEFDNWIHRHFSIIEH